MADRAYYLAEEIAGSDVHRAYREALAGERTHRRGDFAKYHPRAASAPACARLHVARWIARSILDRPVYKTEDILYIRTDVLRCAGIAARYGGIIAAAWASAGLDLADVAALDYVPAVGEAI